MNELYLIVTSTMENLADIKRLIDSIDISNHIHLVFINQSNRDTYLRDVVKIRKNDVKEICIGKRVPLSYARNKGLDYLYANSALAEKAFVMFVDDDAWFPKETLKYILETEIRAFSLKTIDPIQNKSFSKVMKIKGEIKNFHLIHDIVSICLVVPYSELLKSKPYFNENLGLGNQISQGEESLFIYGLHIQGVHIYYDNHLIYHPYKKNFNMKNFYSMSYFWALGLFHVSIIFLWPAVRYLVKYTIACILAIKDRRYLNVSLNVWSGFIDGIMDKYKVIEYKK